MSYLLKIAPLATAAFMAALAPLACTGTSRPPNIVVFYIDDLGWRDLGVMGSGYYETPAIDQLATQGLLFTNAYANAPNCAPSRASLLSGQYTPRHGIFTVGDPARGRARDRKLVPTPNRETLDLDIITFAEILSDAGYRTANVGKWHLGGDGHSPTDQGYAVNVAGYEFGSPPAYFYPYANLSPDAPEWARGRQIADLAADGQAGEYLTDRLTDEAVEFIVAADGAPFLLFLSHYAVHTPIAAPEPLIDKYRDKHASGGHDNPTYAAMIEAVDTSVGRILGTLEQMRLSDNTVVLFMSDNGGFGPVTDMSPLRGSKGMLYEGGVRVPMMVRWPGVVAPGRRSDVPVIGTDLYPTLLQIAGASPRPGQPLDGVSLMPILDGTGSLPERALYWHFPAYLEADRSVPGPWRTTPAGAIRDGRYKLVEFFEDQRVELYDLESDLGEQHDLSPERPELRSRLLGKLRRWRQEIGAPVPTEPNSEFGAAGR